MKSCLWSGVPVGAEASVYSRSSLSLRRSVGAWAVGALCALLCACADTEEADVPAQTATPSIEPTSSPSPTPAASGLQGSAYDVTSVRMTGRVIVRAAPSADSDRLGLVAKDSRFKPLAWRRGSGCGQGWVRIGQGEWVCGKNLAPSSEPPLAVEQPELEPDALIPAIYGDVRNSSAGVYASLSDIKKGKVARKLTGHTVVRKVEEQEVDGVLYWRIASGEYILAADLKPYNPSGFHGVYLEQGVVLPLAFIMPDASYKKPGISSPSIVPLAAGRGLARVYERQAAGSSKSSGFRYRIGEDEWISGPQIRYAAEVEPPKDILPDEPWVDINLSQQVLIAYRGALPYYATLISSGRQDPTPRGLFRIYLKFSETSMGSEMGDDRPYLIENVPWTQFFQAGIALHCAFWHNGFGHPRSRGCVNLAPVDARTLFQLAQPVPPAGWTSLHGTVDRPGTLVRVWSDPDEELFYYGLARDVAKARGVKVRGAPSLKAQMEKTKSEQAPKSAPPVKPGAAVEPAKVDSQKKSPEPGVKASEGAGVGAEGASRGGDKERKPADRAKR